MGNKSFHDFTNHLKNAKASPTSSAKRLVNCDLAMNRIRYMTAGMNEYGYKRQKEHLDNYLKIVHDANKTILPALLNPQPLLDQDQPPFETPGSIFEAYGLLKHGLYFFDNCPGAKAKIADFLGPDRLEYDHRLLVNGKWNLNFGFGQILIVNSNFF